MGSFKRDRPVSAFSRVSATSDRIAVYDNSCRPFLLANFVHPSTCNLSTYVPRVTLRGAPVVVVLSRLMQRVEGGGIAGVHTRLSKTHGSRLLNINIGGTSVYYYYYHLLSKPLIKKKRQRDACPSANTIQNISLHTRGRTNIVIIFPRKLTVIRCY